MIFQNNTGYHGGGFYAEGCCRNVGLGSCHGCCADRDVRELRADLLVLIVSVPLIVKAVGVWGPGGLSGWLVCLVGPESAPGVILPETFSFRLTV